MDAVIARTLLAGEDRAADRDVRRIRSRHPRLSGGGLARRVTRQSGWRCAAVAAAAAAAGQLLERMLAAADLPYEVRSLNRLAGAVARAHGRATTVNERVLMAGASVLFAGAGRIARRGTTAATRGLLGRRYPKSAILLSGLAAGAAAYATVRIFGAAVETFLSNRARRPR